MGKANYWGPQSKEKVNFNFDRKRTIAQAQMDDWQSNQDIAAQKRAAKLSRQADFQMPNGAAVKRDPASVKACGGGSEQMMEPAE